MHYLAGAAIAGAMLERLDTIGCRGIFTVPVFFFITVVNSSSSLLLLFCLAKFCLAGATIAGAMLERLDTIGCRGIFATSVICWALLPHERASKLNPGKLWVFSSSSGSDTLAVIS